jgi:2-dehydropantoate 2-reductase
MSSTYLIIGNGRMANHFSHYLNLLNIEHMKWSRNTDQPKSLCQLSIKASHILVLITDSEIDTFIIRNNLHSMNKTLIHFSGSLHSIYADSAHPLMTFNNSLYALEDYMEIPFNYNSKKFKFDRLLPGLPNIGFYISKEQKDYYHAICVASNNFTTILWQTFIKEIGSTIAMDPKHIFPIMRKTLDNLTLDYENALTGPIARNDHLTIAKNLAALKGNPLHTIYKEMIKLYQLNQKG